MLSMVAFAALITGTMPSSPPPQARQKVSMEFYVVQGPDAQKRYSFAKNGKPFWSWGVDCVTTGAAWESYDTGNRAYAAFHHFSNCQAWAEDTAAKLRAWGFNSLGGWSDFDLFKRYTPDSRLPYFEVLHLGSYDNAPWNDMFDPTFKEAIESAAKSLLPKFVDDPMLVGYFTDNELGWWGDSLFKSYFAMPSSAPGKVRLVRMLRSHYDDDFGRLRRDWETDAAGFDELAKARDITLRPGGEGAQAVNEWLRVLGERYYSVVYDAIRRYDAHHLILGDRYIQYYNIEIAKSSAPYIDVASTNLGADWTDGAISHFFLDTLHKATKRPVIITEFYMCATENRSGNKNSSDGFPVVATQAERAAAFGRYVRHVASLPYVVGAHWFQFTDEPEKGRGDGEDYNMGLVDIFGKPYQGMIRASQSIDFEGIRRAASNPGAPAKVSVPKAPAEPMAGLKAWPRDAGFLPPDSPFPTADLYVAADGDYLYLGLYSMEYMDESLYAGGKVPESERSRWVIQLGDAAPIEIRFGGKDRPPIPSNASVGLHEIPGLRNTLIARIPRPAGTEVVLHSRFETHSRGEFVSWRMPLELEK
ncbi:MAG TPA: hypothetical protein VHE55_07580 [Fimbriimonadaceae bacterium]|nr:hypothetical protein [Fimbriimonadaceae bacterium]